jgi:inhibitor of KinA sporulation pathway (predicted exonuclease)
MVHYYAIIDFECTCWARGGMGDPYIPDHEIIEFPAVFLNSQTLKVEFEFHSYVRPTEEPKLADFCSELTGIDQETVSKAESLDVIIRKFQTFLIKNHITSFTVCADGPWDFEKFLYPECIRKGITYPAWGEKWLDVRKRFAEFFLLEKWIGVNEMLNYLEFDFEGRPHSGIDDARNIARIVKVLHERVGKTLRTNRMLTAIRDKKKRK